MLGIKRNLLLISALLANTGIGFKLNQQGAQSRPPRRKGTKQGRGIFASRWSHGVFKPPLNGKRECYRRVGQRMGFCGQRAIEEGERYLLNHSRYTERAA